MNVSEKLILYIDEVEIILMQIETFGIEQVYHIPKLTFF